MGQFKAPQAIGHGARESPLAMAKQLAFNQLSRNGATVDGDKRTSRARPLRMQGLRHQLLACATFSGHQSCRRRRRQGLDQFTQKLGGIALTNDLCFGTGFHEVQVSGVTQVRCPRAGGWGPVVATLRLGLSKLIN